MLSKNLIDAINDQINYELLSSYLYLSMTAYCEDNDFHGAANFYRIQAREEVDHAMKFYDYLIERDARVVLKGFEDPQVEFNGYKDTFEKSLEHEKSVTSRIYALMDMATEEQPLLNKEQQQALLALARGAIAHALHAPHTAGARPRLSRCFRRLYFRKNRRPLSP